MRRLQRRLTGLGFSPGPIDGRYGPLTTQAVERFQSADGLNVDGIIGPRSLAALNAKPGQASAGLRLGVGYRLVAGSGPVRVLQRRLASLGFAPGPIDGRYGPLTTRAVKRFQSARRLAVNGVVGAGTLHAILTAGRRSTVTVSSQPPPSPPPHRTTQERSTTPAESAPVNRQSPPTLPVAPVLLALAALGIAATLLHSGRTRSREHHQRARGEQTPRGFASELADAHDADPGTRGYRR